MLLQITEPNRNLVQEKLSQALAIGIDLGTTNSVVAICENQKPVIITDAEGTGLLPSVVAYLKGKAPIVGEEALSLIDEVPDHVVTSSKRLMGRSTQEALTSAGKFTPTQNEQATDTMVQLKIGETTKTPVEVASDILRTLKQRAETSLKQAIEKAVITVPAYFDEAARQATKDAANLAGLKVLRLINEPTAAALAYGLDQGLEGIYAVYDLGGGTFDISLLNMTKGVFQVLATGGDVTLGGDDIDRLLVEYFHHLSPEIDLTPALYKQALKTMRSAKEYLTHQDCGMWALPGGKDFPLDRSTLENLSAPLVEKTIDICRQVLIDADLSPQDLKGVVLVGGATRMPLIEGRVTEFFGQDPLNHVNPDEVVALGAALQAEALTKGTDTLLLDVTPLSLGLETMGGIVEKLIPRNTPIPATFSQEFTTYQDGQTMMKIHILQGERELVENCRSLGEFTLNGIPPMVAGAARIMVTLMVDVDGLLTVSATEKTTNTRQEVTLKPSYGLSEEDYRRILAENIIHGEGDIKNRLLIETKVKAQQLLHQLDTAIKVDGDLLSTVERETLVRAMEALEQRLTDADQDVIVERQKMLESMSVPFATRRVKRLVGEAADGLSPAKE
ncbi:MAG: Fe-S protein assembly chaperone HscA [Alphaproteobacteria bacterium]|jgi:molecular chaperone HscA|nr:Fe-S protein assembly chaperone HscA [Alphaproteobacteria bacterium]